MNDLKTRILKLIYRIMRSIIDSSFKVRINGQENIPKTNKVIIIANHCSYLDVPIVARVFYDNLINLSWVISKRNYRHWYFKWLFLLFRVIVTNGTIAKAKLELKKNRWIVIFPEGAGRWFDVGQTDKKRRTSGAAVIALSTGATVVPVGIHGTDKVLPARSFKMDSLQTITVNIGKPFFFEVARQEKIDEALLEKITQEIMQRITELKLN